MQTTARAKRVLTDLSVRTHEVVTAIHRHPKADPGARRRIGEVDVSLLLYFCAVAETLSFTKGAARLGIDQSWLSHKIRQLEGLLGVSLFIRNTRNVELTSAGLALLDPARKLAEVARQAQSAIELLYTTMSGTLRVGALPFSFSDAHRTALLDRLQADHPEVQLAVRNGPTPQLLEDLRAGKVDLAFVTGPFDETGLDLLLLQENSFCLLVPTDHPIAGLPDITAAALSGVRMVLPSEHFSPAAFAVHYGPVVDAGIQVVSVPEFQCSVAYATQWKLPVMCTRAAAERYRADGFAIRPLAFVPRSKKYLVRLSSHRSPSQMLLWEMAEATAHRLAQAA